MLRLVIVALLCASCSACVDPSPPPPARSTGVPGRTGTASVRGTVRFRGTPPPAPRVVRGAAGCGNAAPRTSAIAVSPDGGVAEAFVWVKQGIADGDYPIPRDAVAVDQRGCEFLPRVAGVRAGQPLVFRNGDQTLHNVHAVGSGSNRFNFGMPLTGMEVTRQMTDPQVMVTIGCDVHPWMRVYVGVVRHPFFAVTRADGAFSLSGLPAGTYVVEAWQEAAGRLEQSVTLAERDQRTVDFVFGG